LPSGNADISKRKIFSLRDTPKVMYRRSFFRGARKVRSRVDAKFRERVEICFFAIPAFFWKQLGFSMSLELLSPNFMHQHPGRQGLILTHFYAEKTPKNGFYF
jgi:hypothetical protein